MKWLNLEPRQPGWAVKCQIGWRPGPRWWGVWFTPEWHKGRGPYVSIGLGIIAVYRGY